MNARTSYLKVGGVPFAMGAVMFAGVALQSATPAGAAVAPADKCEAAKAKSAGKYSSCRLGVYAKAIKGMASADADKLTGCLDKVGASYTKAEDKAEGACPTTADSATVQGVVDACTTAVVTALGGVPGPGGDPAKCQSGKVGGAGKYAACRLGALAKSIAAGVAPDFTKCEEKLLGKFTKLEEGTCTTTLDHAAIKALVDACYTQVAATIDGVPDPVVEFSQNFEALNQMSGTALGDAGFLGFANVFDSMGGYIYGYGTFPAPNGTGGFSNVAVGQGGPAQGNQQLVVFSDYNNGDHALGRLIEANVFRERFIVAGDVGRTLTFAFDAKRGDIVPATTALAFIKTLDPNNGYATTNFITLDTTALPLTWAGYTRTLNITAGLVGQIMQVGFASTATMYTPSGNYYDNIVVSTLPSP